MAIMWTEMLSVGVEQIDKQHRELFEHANRLFEAGQKGKSKEVIGELLQFLDQYTKTHFRDEEKYMESIKYPELDVQKRAHADFIASLQNLRNEFEKSGGNLTVVLNANRLVVDWLTNHIANQDKKIGKYAKSVGK